MPSYIIYEKPGLPVEEAIESAVFVKDHYSMLAFFLPLVWIVIRRLWWVLLGYLLLLVPLYLVDTHLPVWAGMLLTLLIGLWFALEAPSLISWSLKRKGYVELGSLYAENARPLRSPLCQGKARRGLRQCAQGRITCRNRSRVSEPYGRP